MGKIIISWSTLLKFMINQNGSKESTPDVCPEYRGNPSAESSDESSQSEEPEPQSEKSLKENGGSSNGSLETNGVDRFERKVNQIESSTDTLVPENDAAVDNTRNGVEVTIGFVNVTLSSSLLCY